MDIRKLIRSPERVKACVQELPDHRLVAKKPVKIYIPARFTERNLASLGVETYIVGIYAMVVEDAYFASSTVNAMIRIEPTSVMRLLIEDEEYIEFSFEAGSTIMSSTMLVKDAPLVYRICDEILMKGRVPWYIDYLQLGKLFKTAKKHAGANIGEHHEVGELLASAIARNAENRYEFYRTVVKSLDDIHRKPPVFIPLRSVQYGATNTLNKLAGSYFNEGVVSALVSPATRTENIERVLRK